MVESLIEKIANSLCVNPNISTTDKSLKTFSFVNNIAKLDNAYITIDVWHLRACFGTTIRSTPSRKAYDQIRLLTIEKAKQGLSGRRSLGKNKGMLFTFPNLNFS